MGIGRLTDYKIDQIQTYYGYAIRNNKHSEILLQDAIWAIFYHSIAGPSHEGLQEQHRYCPKGPESWSKYQLAQANGTTCIRKKRAYLPSLERN